MNKYSEDLSMPDYPTPEMPDHLMSLIEEVKSTPEAPSQEHPASANLDIILSKFLNNGELNDIELQQLAEDERMALEEVQRKTRTAKKRPDEYQKLFYRRAFKFAEKEFFGKRNKNKSRKMSGFYHFHFESAAQKMNVPLINFYHPDKKTRPGLKVGQKSFNRCYVRLLLRSESFRAVSRAYRGRFYQECLAEREQKVGKFVSYLRGVASKHGRDSQKMREVIRSSKCKVPWTNQEIQEADRRALDDLEHYQLQFSETGGDQESPQEEDNSSIMSEMVAQS